MSAHYYGDGTIRPRELVENLVGAVAKESGEDIVKIGNYFSSVVKEKAKREGGAWSEYYEARNLLR